MFNQLLLFIHPSFRLGNATHYYPRIYFDLFLLGHLGGSIGRIISPLKATTRCFLLCFILTIIINIPGTEIITISTLLYSSSRRRHLIMILEIYSCSSIDHSIIHVFDGDHKCIWSWTHPSAHWSLLFNQSFLTADIISSTWTLTLTKCVCSFLKRSLHSYDKCYTILDAHVPSSSLHLILWSRNYILIPQTISDIISLQSSKLFVHLHRFVTLHPSWWMDRKNQFLSPFLSRYRRKLEYCTRLSL